MDMFEKSTILLIAEVDCEGKGEDLCGSLGIEGYPSLKYGDVNQLEDYIGTFGFDELLEFVGKNLAPICSPAHLDLCSADQKKKIDTMYNQGIDKLEATLSEFEKKVESTESYHEKQMDQMYEAYEKKYDKLLGDKEKNLQALKEKNDYKLIKRVVAHLEYQLERKSHETS